MEVILQNIETIIIAAAPAITAIFTMIFGFIKLVNQFKTNKDETSTKLNSIVEENKKIKSQLLIVNEENIKLKKTMNELLTNITKVEHKGE